jgi:hypothetical protein
MRAFEYAFRQGGASLWRSRGSSAFAVLAIALAIIVLGALLLMTWNAERLLARWSDAAEFSVYLRDDATADQRSAIETAIEPERAGRGPGLRLEGRGVDAVPARVRRAGRVDDRASTRIHSRRRSRCGSVPVPIATPPKRWCGA